jgi:ribosomal protein L24E
LDHWTESLSWGWKFQGEHASLIVEFRNSKDWKRGQLTYDPKSKKYRLTAVDTKGKERIFEGDYKRGYLNLDFTDADTGETLRWRMNSAGEGLRFVYSVQRRPKGSTIFTPLYQVEAGKVGESLAGSSQERECVVTGGRGTIPVTYQGKTYYVCCSGCRDAFNENPEKILREYAERKKKEK